MKPVGFAYHRELGTIHISGFKMAQSAKYRNVRRHPEVAFVVDTEPPQASPTPISWKSVA